MSLSDFGQVYRETLKELVNTDRASISLYRTLAEENKNEAANIVLAIVLHLQTCPPTCRLPALYLADSIMKRVGEPYITCFATALPEVFDLVWNGADSATRQSLFKLVGTWDALLPPASLQLLKSKSGIGAPPLGQHRPQPPALLPTIHQSQQQTSAYGLQVQQQPVPILQHPLAAGFVGLPASPPNQANLQPSVVPVLNTDPRLSTLPTASAATVLLPPALGAPFAQHVPSSTLAPPPFHLQPQPLQLQPQPLPVQHQLPPPPLQPIPAAQTAGSPQFLASLLTLGTRLGMAPQQMHALPPAALGPLQHQLMQPPILLPPLPQQSQVQAAVSEALQMLRPAARVKRPLVLNAQQLKVYDASAVDDLLRASEETRKRFLDVAFHRIRRAKQSSEVSRQWYLALDSWLIGAAGDALTGLDNEGNPEAEAEQELPLVEEDPSQTECAISGEPFERSYDPDSDKWYYEDAVVLTGEQAARYGVMDGSIVKVQAIAGAPPSKTKSSGQTHVLKPVSNPVVRESPATLSSAAATEAGQPAAWLDAGKPAATAARRSSSPSPTAGRPAFILGVAEVVSSAPTIKQEPVATVASGLASPSTLAVGSGLLSSAKSPTGTAGVMAAVASSSGADTSGAHPDTATRQDVGSSAFSNVQSAVGGAPVHATGAASLQQPQPACGEHVAAATAGDAQGGGLAVSGREKRDREDAISAEPALTALPLDLINADPDAVVKMLQALAAGMGLPVSASAPLHAVKGVKTRSVAGNESGISEPGQLTRVVSGSEGLAEEGSASKRIKV